MDDSKKGIARIPVPSKNPEGRSEEREGHSSHREGRLAQEPALDRVAAVGAAISEPSLPVAWKSPRGKLRPTPKRDPALVPLVGLLLAFCLISLIVQLLIAFG